jgi:hypothetical protein
MGRRRLGLLRLVQAVTVLGALIVICNLWSFTGRVHSRDGDHKRGAGGTEPLVVPHSRTSDPFTAWDVSLPLACADAYRTAKAFASTPIGNTEINMSRLIAGMTVVNSLADLPARYYTKRRLSPAERLPLPQVVPGVSLTALAAARNQSRATSSILYCFQDALIADSTMVGPVSRLGEGKVLGEGGTAPDPPYLLQLNKAWYPDARGIQEMAEHQPTLVRVQSLLVQLTGWTGWGFNHFVL